LKAPATSHESGNYHVNGNTEVVSSSTSTSLWRHQDFLRLWVAETVSRLGDFITFLALPLTAVVIFKATPTQMGILRALYSAAAVLIGLFAGVWIDRLRRRPILVWTDLGFTILYISIPLATILGLLHITHLYLIQFMSGILWFFSDVALRSFLPSLVEHKQLVEANSKLGLTHSIAAMAGPSMAGTIVQVVTAPIAMFFDALSFLVSALFVWRIRTPEPPLRPDKAPRKYWVEIREGLDIVFSHPLLRSLTEALCLQHFFTSFISAVFVLYATNVLNIKPFFLGMIFSAYGPGYLLAALFTPRLARRYGIGPLIIGATLLNAIAVSIIPLARGPMPAILSLLIIAHLLIAASLQINEISMLSLRQSVAPNNLQGRINGSFRFIILTADLLGAILIGVFGEVVSLKTIIAIGAGGLSLPFIRLLFSSLYKLQRLPD
jgi:predicted MFS family arabinose efflux permease